VGDHSIAEASSSLIFESCEGIAERCQTLLHVKIQRAHDVFERAVGC